MHQLQSNSDELDFLFNHRKGFISVPMKQYNLKYDEQRYTRPAYKPVLVRPARLVNTTKIIKKPKKKKFNFSMFVTVLLMAAFVYCCVMPFSYKYFLTPVFQNPEKSSFNVKVEDIYSPTSAYLHNNDFMGSRILSGAEQDAPDMMELNLTDEMVGVENTIKAIAAEYPNVHGSVFAWDYETGKYVSYNSDETFPAASIIKLPVLLQLFRSMEFGQRTIDEKMTLTDFYRAEGSGDLQFQKEGNQYSLDSLARKMIEISDNSSTNMLMSSIGGMSDVNRAVRAWGLQHTQVNNWLPDMKGTNYTTTADLARMLYNIGNDEFLSADSREKILDYMGHVKNNRLLVAGLGSGAKCWHKTGDIGHMLGDAGIVRTASGHKYIVAIMAKRPYNNPNGKDFVVRASNAVYNAMESRNLN